MKITFIITDNLSMQQLEHKYFLCLALLNFEHQVTVVFVDQAFQSIVTEPEIKKSWLALKIYGVETFYQLNLNCISETPSSVEHCQIISKISFDALKDEMDLLL
jgi:hypothetical protein